VEIYSEGNISRQNVVKLCAEFRGGRVSMEDCEWSSKPTRARTDDNSALMEITIFNNRRITVGGLQHGLNLSNGTFLIIILDLRFYKVCENWLPRALTEDLNKRKYLVLRRFCNDII
jgi:hypothetical protein